MICPKCSTVCDEDLRFCDVCGFDLAAPEEPIPEILVVEQPIVAPQPPISSHVSTDTVPPAPKKGRLWPPLVILSVMICLGTLLFFLFPGPSGAATPGTAETPWFSIEDGAVSFHPEFYTGNSELIIPESVNGQTVTAIADYGFSGIGTITTVILPDTVTHIGDYAFSSCVGLRGIFIPSTVQTVGVYAFADCDGLEAISLPGTLEELGHDALSSCNSLRYILFDGTYAQWNELYKGYFVSTVELHATDGVYTSRP